MRFTLALLACAALAACGDDDADIGEDGGAAGFGGSTPGDGDGDGDGDDDATVPEEDGGPGCSTDDECSDGINCTGKERCIDGGCRTGEPPDCTAEHYCIEATGECECSNPNLDEDGYDAKACGGLDCDDTNFLIHPDATEVCAPLGDSTDEDCVATSYQNEATQDGDTDGDQQVSALCFNIDAESGERFGGTDCDDTDDATYDGADEQCDNADNNCNGQVDEGQVDGMGPVVPHGLSIPFYPDVDRDGYGDHDAEPMRRCQDFPPLGYVPFDRPHDCDDSNEDVNIAETELCDGVDNDCDDLIDKADDNDQPLSRPIEFTDTTVDCLPPEAGAKPEWVITDCPGEPGDPDELLWCTGVVDLGCTTDATSLSNCRECGNECNFACGRTGCDEVEQIALGADHSCALTREGVVACWGYGFQGRLGIGESSSTATPVELLRIPQASAIAAGEDASCAVLGTEKDVHCWGSNANAILANTDIDRTFSPFPVPVTGFDSPILNGIESVAVGQRHACAVRDTGELYCWGNGENGRLGNESFLPELWDDAVEVMREGGQPVVDADGLSVGAAHSCLITFDDNVDCWGDNTEGQLGDSQYTEAYADFARPVPGLSAVDQVAAGGAHTCALSQGDVLCWGLNDSFQLGRESSAQDAMPLAVEGLTQSTSIVAGNRFTCALDVAGDVWCWGRNNRGQLGDPDLDETFVPQRIELADPVVAISAGEAHACAATAERTYCWGDNTLGQLGLGQSSYESVTTPEPIRILDRQIR